MTATERERERDRYRKRKIGNNMRASSITAFLLILSWNCIDFIDPHRWLVNAANPSTKKGTTRFSSLKIHSNIRYRFARTSLIGELSNPGGQVQEITWDVILPESAFVSNLSAIINNQHFNGEVVILDKKQARPKYKVMRPPGTAAFSLQLHAPAKSRMTLSLSYEQLLDRRLGQYEQTIYLIPGQDMDTLDIQVDIEETNAISKVKVPPMIDSKSSVVIQKTSARATTIKYSASASQLRRLSLKTTAEFCVQYDLTRGSGAGNILLSNGYFVQYFRVDNWSTLPMDIAFVLDVSGSMFQNGINQLKTAMHSILSKLRDTDRFGIVVYNMNVDLWKDKMVHATKENIDEAWDFINGQIPFGRSNINDALLKGLSLIQKSSLASAAFRAMNIFFLTDGDASEGITQTSKIITNVKNANRMQIPIHSILIADASFHLANQLALTSHGQSLRIYSPEQLITELKEFFDHISNVLAKQLRFKYADQLVKKTTQNDFQVYYEGSELVVAGMCKQGAENIDPSVVLINSDGERTMQVSSDSYTQDVGNIAERVFALLSVKQTMKRAFGYGEEQDEDGIYKKAADIALKYKYLTPMTSMTVSSKESVLGSANSQKPFRSNGRVYGVHGGYGGGGGDPHFIMDITGLDIPICFNVISQPRQILTLVDDPSTRIQATASIVLMRSNSSHHFKTYMGEIQVRAPGLELKVTPHSIIANSQSLSWTSESIIKFATSDVTSHGDGKIFTIRIGNEVRFAVKRVVRHGIPHKVDFLDFYITDRRGLSIRTEGIVGGLVHLVGYVRWTRKYLNGKLKAHLVLYNRYKRVQTAVMAVLKERPDPLTHRKPCWMLWRNTYKQLVHFQAKRKFQRKN